MRYFKHLLFAAVVAGCTGTGSVQYAASADVSPPELIEIEPDVQVIADYDQPVFYSEGVYWRYDSGTWYRSPNYNRGWIRIATPPARIRQIQRPEAYVHFRAHEGDRREREARAYQPGPEVRDHRTNPPPPPPAPAPVTTGPEVRDHREGPPAPAPLPPSSGPDVRDHRDDRHDDRDERRQDQRDERRDDRRDEKADRRDEKLERRDEKLERRDEKRDEKAERRDEKRDEKAERRDEKRDEKAQKHEDKHDDHGNHGHH